MSHRGDVHRSDFRRVPAAARCESFAQEHAAPQIERAVVLRIAVLATKKGSPSMVKRRRPQSGAITSSGTGDTSDRLLENAREKRGWTRDFASFGDGSTHADITIRNGE